MQHDVDDSLVITITTLVNNNDENRSNEINNSIDIMMYKYKCRDRIERDSQWERERERDGEGSRQSERYLVCIGIYLNGNYIVYCSCFALFIYIYNWGISINIKTLPYWKVRNDAFSSVFIHYITTKLRFTSRGLNHARRRSHGCSVQTTSSTST